MGKKRTFKAGDEVYDISEAEVEEFLKDVPSAKEVKSFIVDKDTFDIPLDEVDEFISEVPSAKPLYEEPVSEEIPTITLDQAEVEGKPVEWEGGARTMPAPKGAIKASNKSGGFTIADGGAEWTGDAGTPHTLTKEVKDVFIKHALELPDNVKSSEVGSRVFVNTFSKKMGVSPKDLKQVYKDAVQAEKELKELKERYDQTGDIDALYRAAELHNSIGQHDLAYEAYDALEGKLRQIGEQEFSDPNNPNKRPDYIQERMKPAVAGMAYTEGLRGNMAEARRLQALSGYKGQEFSSVGGGSFVQPTPEAISTPTPESEYMGGIADAIEKITMLGPASEMTELGIDKIAKHLPIAFDPYAYGPKRITSTIGVVTGGVETLMGVAGMTTPAGSLFAMPLIQVQNVAPEVAEWIMPLSRTLHHYYQDKGERVPEWAENVTILADIALLGGLTHAGSKKVVKSMASREFGKIFDELPPESIESLAKVAEKRWEASGKNPEVYGAEMKSRIEELKPQIEEIKTDLEASQVEPYEPQPHPESLLHVKDGTDVMMNGVEGVLEYGDDMTPYFVDGEGKSTQIKVADKANAVETLSELGIQVLPEITPEQIARATADAEQVGKVKFRGKEYFVSIDRVGNENPTGDHVYRVMPDGTMVDVFDSSPSPIKKFSQERKLEVVNEFLASKGLPPRKALTEVKAKMEASVVEAVPTEGADPLPITEVEPVVGVEDVPMEVAAPKIEVVEETLPAKEPVSPAVEVQIEEFGVPKEDVAPVKSLLDNVFTGLKKAGLTVSKTLDEWIGIGKGEAKEYSLKINGKEVKVKNTGADVVNGFYSPLEKTISETKFDKLPTKQWIEKFGKGEEAKWTGLTEWLSQQEGTVSKADIQKFLKENRIEIVEVVKGGEKGKDYSARKQEIESELEANGYSLELDMGGDGYMLIDKAGELADYDSLPENVQKIHEEYNEISDDSFNQFSKTTTQDTKFGQYQLAGDKNGYKEVLVTMPSKKMSYSAHEFDPLNDSNLGAQEGDWIIKNNKGEDVSYVERDYAETPEEAMEEFEANQLPYERESDNLLGNTSNEFKSSHFNEPNILVHLRMNTRLDAQGKKVLFLEEVQSDWGQKGREEGFKGDETEANKLRSEFDKKYGEGWGRANLSLEDFNRFEKSNISLDGVPTAPFVTETAQWTKLAVKTALKEAVKQGADKIAWTTGEQQNARYDLSKSVDEIGYLKNENGTYSISGFKNGYGNPIDKSIPENKLQDYVGKEVAQKIINNEGEQGKNGAMNLITGDQLKLEGKGMKGYYGSPTEGNLGILGEVVKNVAKQEVKTTDVVGEQQHSIDITPELKASVEGGQPLFKGSQAQYHIQSGKNIIEAIKNFNGSKKATVAITHEIMHPTVVAIIDGAKLGVEKGIKHTDTIVSEYNKAKGKKITAQELIEGNDAFKEGKTSDTYRAVQEFIADSWEKYHRDGGKGFSEAFQKALEQITQAFTDVYKTLKGKELTPELRKMFDEILGKEPEPVKVKEPRIESDVETRVRELKQDVINIGYEIGHEMEKNSLAEFTPEMYGVQNMPYIKPESAAKETGGRVGARGDINPSFVHKTKGVSVGKAAEILERRAADDGLHPHLDSEDWRAIVIDILHAGSKENYVKYNTKFGKERTRILKQEMGEKKAELAEAIKDLENADWEKLGFDSKKEFKQHVRDIKQGKQLEQYEADAMDVVAQMDDVAVDRMLKELDENYPITEQEINEFYEKHNIEEGGTSAEVSITEIREGKTAEPEVKTTREGELVSEAKTTPPITPEPPVTLTTKEKALKAVDDLENFLLNIPGVKDTTGAERMGTPFSMEEAVKFFTKTLRESIEQGYKVKDAIERAIGKSKDKYSEMFENISEEDLRARASKQYEDQGVSLDKPVEQQFGASHASVAEVREAMGLGDFERVSEYEQRDVKTVMTKGKELAGKIDVQELATDVNNGRPISAEEQAALVYEETQIHNEFEAKETEINRLIAKGAMNEADQAIISLQEIKHRQNNILSALDKAGSEMGLAFRMRQVMNKRDYSVVGLERRWSKANGGKEVPKDMKHEFAEKAKIVKEEAEALRKIDEAKDRQIQEQALLDIEESANRAKQTPDQRVKAAKKARKQELAQKFRGVFNDATNIAKAMVDKEFYEYARLVFEDAVGDFKEFSKRMIGDLGKNVEPHLQDIFDKASKKEYEKAYQDENGIHIDRDLLVDIIESIERDPKTGTKSAKEFMDKVEEAVKVDLPDVERRQIQDAVSGYGKQSNKTLSQLQQDLNQVKRDLQLVSGLDDAKTKKGVLRTGSPPKPPTDYQRGLQKQIREELKDQPQSQEELTKKWATALDRTKSALRNAITDNTKRIEDIKNGTAVPKTPKDKLKLDSEAEQLQEMNNDLKKELKELEGKKKLTDQQLLDLTIKAVERVAEKYELRTQEIRKTGTYTKDTPRILSSPELDIARLDRDAKKAEYEQALKDNNLDVLEYASRQLSASQKRVANLENKIKANDISFAAKALNRIDYNNNPELAASIYQEKVLKDTIKKMREEQGLVEAREREMWAKRKEKQIKDIQHRIKTKDFGKKVPKEKILDIEEARIQRRLDRAKFDLDVKIEASRLQNMGTTEKLRDHLNSLINLPKGLMASFDISAPLRQGAILFARHPIYGLKNSREMIKDWFSKEHAEAWHEDLIRSDEYIRAKNAGLFISEPMARLVAAEEQFQTKYLNKVPGFSASNRAYSGFLNRMRMDVFNQFYDGLIQDRFTGKALQNELNSMAHIINNFSGRGKLGKGGELASPLLNSLFFAPRFVTSRVNTLANALSGYWLEGRWWGKQKMGTRARIEAYKSLGAYVATGTAILKMADAAGLDVEIDPRSSDFGKIKIGDLRYDIWAGHQQIIVLLSRIANQASIDLRTGKVKPFDEDTNTWTTVKNFGRSKASPFVGYGIDAMTGVNSQYEKFEWDKEAWKISLPLLLQDPVMRLIYDDYVSMYREGEAGVGTFAASATGVGVNWIKPHEDVVNAKLTPKSDKLMLNKMYTPQRTKDQEVYVKGKPYHISDEQLKRIQKIRAKEAGKLINKDYSDLRKLSEEEYASEVNSYYNKGLKEAYDKVLPRGWSEDNK